MGTPESEQVLLRRDTAEFELQTFTVVPKTTLVVCKRCGMSMTPGEIVGMRADVTLRTYICPSCNAECICDISYSRSPGMLENHISSTELLKRDDGIYIPGEKKFE